MKRKIFFEQAKYNLMVNKLIKYIMSYLVFILVFVISFAFAMKGVYENLFFSKSFFLANNAENYASFTFVINLLIIIFGVFSLLFSFSLSNKLFSKKNRKYRVFLFSGISKNELLRNNFLFLILVNLACYVFFVVAFLLTFSILSFITKFNFVLFLIKEKFLLNIFLKIANYINVSIFVFLVIIITKKSLWNYIFLFLVIISFYFSVVIELNNAILFYDDNTKKDDISNILVLSFLIITTILPLSGSSSVSWQYFNNNFTYFMIFLNILYLFIDYIFIKFACKHMKY